MDASYLSGFRLGQLPFRAVLISEPIPVGHAGPPIAGLDAEALEDSNERSTC